VTLGQRLKHLAPGLTFRSAPEKCGAVAMVDVDIPTVATDPEVRREIVLTRYTQPEAELRLLLEKLKLDLPGQPPPRIGTSNVPRDGARARPTTPAGPAAPPAQNQPRPMPP